MTLLPPLRGELLPDVRALARDVLAPIVATSTPGRVSRELVAALAEHDLLPRIFPTELGGSAEGRPTATELCILREAIAAESPQAETTFAVQGLGAYPILEDGGRELAARWIPAVARGEAVAAFALSEPDAGSDAAALALAAERDGDGWRLSGEKTWISHAPDADVYTVFARTTPDAGASGVTAFAVPGDAAGLEGEPIALIAPHALGALRFDGVRVGPDQVLGEVDAGFRVAMRTLDLFRPSVGAAAVGMATRALEEATAHADRREAFGGRLRDLQAVAHRLADAATALEAARLLVYEAAAAHDAGGRDTKLAAMAKLHATEAAQRVIDDAVQLHGAAGLVADGVVGELYREVRALRIYEGASEVQRTIIARELYRDG
jgi:acyl-CoA dehydrogenase